MKEKELKKILLKHVKWLNEEKGGKRADLHGADLRGANLHEANLQWADLHEANLQGANLQGADLHEADPHGADLRGANLQWADLHEANLQWANLHEANLRGANLDFSVLPLWCGSFDMKVDDRFVAQLFCHIGRFDVSKCCKRYRDIIKKLPVDDFCNYRDDVKKVRE